LSTALLFCGIDLPCCCSCENKTAKFDFEVKDGIIKYNGRYYYAELTVITTCKSGRLYYYEHPHTPIEGGRPVIELADVTVIEGSMDVSPALTQVNIRRGDVLERTCYLPDDFEPGEYTVKVSWNKSEEIFENVRFVREE
jgi:uncharacterized protein (DUF169 family)